MISPSDQNLIQLYVPAARREAFSALFAIDGAMASCPSLEAWVDAASRYPDTTAGRDPVIYAEGRCSGSAQLAGIPVCVAIGAQ